MLPKLPLRIETEDRYPFIAIVSEDETTVDSLREFTDDPDPWPIPDARQAAERRLAELTALIEAATPKCPIRKGYDDDRFLGWWVTDRHGVTRYWETEAERNAVYDALVALWHKEQGS